MKQNSNQTIERWGNSLYRYSSRGRIPAPCFYVAHSLGLTGFVYNDSQGVYVEIQGCTSDLQFVFRCDSR